MKKRLSVILLGMVFLLTMGAAGEAADPIKLGAFFDLTGPSAAIGTPTKLVAEMVVKKINGEGGIEGRPLQLVIADDEGDPTKAALIAKKFIESDKVTAIIGPTRTDTGMASKPIIEQMKVPTFMCVGGDPVITVPPFQWTFKSPQRTSVAVKKTFDYLKKKGIQKIAVITSADGFGRDGKTWLDRLSPEYGLKIAAGESFQATDSEDQGRFAGGDHLLDHRQSRLHCGQERPAAGHQSPPVPVPRPAGPDLYQTGRGSLGGERHALHQTAGRRPASRLRSAEKDHSRVHPPLPGSVQV
jgi:hypothetical protein